MTITDAMRYAKHKKVFKETSYDPETQVRSGREVLAPDEPCTRANCRAHRRNLARVWRRHMRSLLGRREA